MQHINTSLPPVAVKLLVWVDGAWVLVRRLSWITNKDTVVPFEYVEKPGQYIDIPRNKIQWSLP